MPSAQLLLAKGVAQAEQGHRVLYDAKRRHRLAADALRWRVRRDELRVALLQPAQLAHEVVVLAVADLRLVEDVIAVVVERNLGAQLFDTKLCELQLFVEVGHCASEAIR